MIFIRYKIDGKAYPSVTEIIHQDSIFKNSKPGFAANVGTLLHYHILKKYARLDSPIIPFWNIDEKLVHTKIHNGLRMWNDLDLVFDVADVESLYKDDNYGYAGRIDLLGKVNNVLTVIDIKTGGYYPEYVMQLAAYMHLTDADNGLIIQIDTDDRRNPELKPHIYGYEKAVLDEAFSRFVELLSRFYQQF